MTSINSNQPTIFNLFAEISEKKDRCIGYEQSHFQIIDASQADKNAANPEQFAALINAIGRSITYDTLDKVENLKTAESTLIGLEKLSVRANQSKNAGLTYLASNTFTAKAVLVRMRIRALTPKIV